MCLLCVMEPNKTPTRAELVNASECNPDGFGYAIALPDQIITARSMNADELISDFFAMREKYPDTWAMWHARLTTHGGNTLENCHPFKVGSDERTYLAHNGILDVRMTKTDSHRSDTRIFAETILPAMGGSVALDNPYVFEMLETFASGSKIAVLTANPRNKYPVYIINEHLGKWDSGIWWSNDSHKPYSNRYWLGYSKKSTTPAVLEGEVKAWESSAYDYADDGICPSCKNDLTQPEQMKWLDDYGSCKYCGFCFDCFAEVMDCMCHTPVSAQGGWAYGY